MLIKVTEAWRKEDDDKPFIHKDDMPIYINADSVTSILTHRLNGLTTVCVSGNYFQIRESVEYILDKVNESQSSTNLLKLLKKEKEDA